MPVEATLCRFIVDTVSSKDEAWGFYLISSGSPTEHSCAVIEILKHRKCDDVSSGSIVSHVSEIPVHTPVCLL